MKLITALLAGRAPQNEYAVPFKAMLPLKLRNEVSNKGERSSSAECVQELTILMACMKTNEFNQPPCSKEIESFQSCIKLNTANRKIKEEKELKGILTPGDRRLGSKQINRMLRKFPAL